MLGICVGMQILFDRGVEHGHDAEGCGEWPGVVEQLKAPVLPHMGWNTVEVPDGTVLFDGLADERFYFVHSYGVRDFPLAADGPPSPLRQAAGDLGRARRPVRRRRGERRRCRRPSSTPRRAATPAPTC